MFSRDESPLPLDVKALEAFHKLSLICKYWGHSRGAGHTRAATVKDRTKVAYLVWSPEDRKKLEHMLWENGQDNVAVLTVQEATGRSHKIANLHHMPLVVDHYVIQRLMADIEPLFTHHSPSLLLASVMGAIQALSTENESLRAELGNFRDTTKE